MTETRNVAETGHKTDPGQAVPATIAATTLRRHLTGMLALNIPDPGHPGGDWHKHAA